MTLQQKGECYRQHLRFILFCQLLFFVANTAATLESSAAAAAATRKHAFEAAVNHNNKNGNAADNEVEIPQSVEEQYVDFLAHVAQIEAKQQAREQQQQLALAAAFPDAATARFFAKMHNENNMFNQHQKQKYQHDEIACTIKIPMEITGTCQRTPPGDVLCVAGDHMDLSPICM